MGNTPTNGFSKYLPTIQQLLTICAAIAAIAGAFIAYKLAPLANRISLIEQKVSAIENDYSRRTYVETGFGHIITSLEDIKGDIKELRSDLKLSGR